MLQWQKPRLNKHTEIGNTAAESVLFSFKIVTYIPVNFYMIKLVSYLNYIY